MEPAKDHILNSCFKRQGHSMLDRVNAFLLLFAVYNIFGGEAAYRP